METGPPVRRWAGMALQVSIPRVAKTGVFRRGHRGTQTCVPHRSGRVQPDEGDR